ncbi:MAG TPA: glycerol-3-phosphate dehydrogenase/oxidase [Candidatus Anammoximicrobium sp.]|nr:glycerol-3-phosphate dehydrogenase/oxidase [Candidatus Anammoximicrobium sp.]
MSASRITDSEMGRHAAGVADRPVVILGAGINGAALARELVLNGVPVLLVDTADMAYGTTAYSSRLIHGGLRYLEYGEFSLVRESLEERNRLLRLAPQYVRPLRLAIPVGKRTGGWMSSIRRFLGARSSAAERGLWLVRVGLGFYDLYARDSHLPRHSATRVGAAGSVPVDPRRYRWLCTYWDAQILYPERFVVALVEDARAAADEQGVEFALYTYHRVRLVGDRVQIHRAGGADGEPVRTVDPAAVVNATGAWVDRTLGQLDIITRPLIGGTKGSHFLTFHPALAEALGGQGVYAEAEDGRPVFLLPWDRGTLVGTTDLPFTGDPGEAVAGADELDYLVGVVRQLFPQIELTREDVHLHYAGVRPLPQTGGATPASVTRRHWMEAHLGSGVPVYSIIGGKLTTCRSLAEESAATILQRLGRSPRANSRERPIPGGESYPVDEAALEAQWRRLGDRFRLPEESVRAIWTLYGSRTESLLAELDAPLGDCVAGTPLPKSLVRRVIRREWVATLDDLIERRLMLLYDPRLSQATLQDLAGLLVQEGKLAADDVVPQVRATCQRLLDHFGKRTPD